MVEGSVRAGGGPRLTVWVTRTLPGAALTAARLRRLGWGPSVVPLLEVRLLDTPVCMDRVGALAFTSPNGVTAFTRLRDERALPVFAVGDGTADAARGAGFAKVFSAAGDVHDLVALIAARRESFSGLLLRPGPGKPAGDLDSALATRGIQAKSCVVYETIATDLNASIPQVARVLAGDMAAVLIHSPRAGRRLASLLNGPIPASCRVVCISPAAARPLIEVGCNVAIAAHPGEAGVLAALGGAG